MAETKREQYAKTKQRLENKYQEGQIAEEDYKRIIQFLNSKDPENIAVSGNDTKKPATLKGYADSLQQVAKRMDKPLSEATSEDINNHFQGLKDGTYPDIKDNGLAGNTISNYQSTIRKFLSYHSDLGINPEDIPIYDRESSKVSSSEVLSRAEINAIREVIDNPRDRVILELGINTGQRITALQTLRICDIDLDKGKTGAFRYNPQAEGLKGAEQNGTWRPLLGAKKPVQEWLNYHPNPEPEAYLITQRPAWKRTSGETMLSQQSINRLLKNMVDKADIDRGKSDIRFHYLRHTFVTIAVREWDMDNDTIKRLIGHSPDSTVMETTYQHLTDKEYQDKAEEAIGVKQPEESNTLTPNICPVCDYQLQSEWKTCPNCGSVFSPEAKEVKEQVESDLWQSKGQAETEKQEAGVDTLQEALKDNPEKVLQSAIEEMDLDLSDL